MSDENIEKSTSLSGGLTSDQIQKLKRQSHANHIYLIEVENLEDEKENLEDEGLFFWFKEMDMTVFSLMSKYIDTDPIKAVQVIIDNTLIKGDPEKLKEVAVFSAVSSKLMSVIATAKAKLKKF